MTKSLLYSSPPIWILLGVLLTLASEMNSTAVHTYRAELFPTHIRAKAIGELEHALDVVLGVRVDADVHSVLERDANTVDVEIHADDVPRAYLTGNGGGEIAVPATQVDNDHAGLDMQGSHDAIRIGP